MEKIKIDPEKEMSVRIFKHPPFNPMEVSATDKGIAGLSFISGRESECVDKNSGSPISDEFIRSAVSQLRAYFSGSLEFFTLPLDLDCVSDFQKMVLLDTANIPYGEVRTYGEVALGIGKPGAARAVGGALAHNPIALVIPCHRVVAHDGHLRGFSSPGGITAKAKLLIHEGVRVVHGRVLLDVC